MKKILSIILTVTMVFSLVAAFRTPTASAFPTTNAIVLTKTGSFSTLTSNLRLYEKLGTANPDPAIDPDWTFNYFSIYDASLPANQLNNASLGQAGMKYEVYRMGETIYGYVNGLDKTKNWQAILAQYVSGTTYKVVDTLKQVAGINKFTLSTGNVATDGEYLILIYYDFAYGPGVSIDISTALPAFTPEVVYITYNFKITNFSFNTCSSYYTMTLFVTRGNGQSVLADKVRVWVTYPNGHDAAAYWIPPLSSGTLTITFPADDPADADTLPEVGKFYIYMLDDYNGYNLTVGYNFGEPNTLDEIAYYYLSNIPTSTLNLSTYISPIRIYKNQTAQPILLHLVDQDGNPLTGLASNTSPNPALFKWSFTAPTASGYYDANSNSVIDSGELRWTVGGLTAAPTLTEISAGFYRFVIGVATSVDVRFRATWTPPYGTSVSSNQIIINTIDKTVFNPYVDVTAPAAITPYGQGPWKLDSIESVYDKLPCTIGNSFDIMVGSWDTTYDAVNEEYVFSGNSNASADNWYVYDASWEINGPVEMWEQISGPGDAYGCNPLLGDNWRVLVTQKGKISVSVNMTAWERVDKTCPVWNRVVTENVAKPTVTEMSQNACCHTYTKTFDICEVNSCTYGGVTLSGANITDSTTVEVGKKVDKFTVSVDNTGAPTDLACSCPYDAVLIYMTDANGNLLKNAFTVDTWGGSPVKGSMIWYNPQYNDALNMFDHPYIPDQPIQTYLPTGIYNESGAPVDSGLKFEGGCPVTLDGITFNYPTGTSCYYSIVVKVFGWERKYDACGNPTYTFPMIAEDLYPITVTPSVTTLTATHTITEGTVDPDQMLAGVPAIIDITNPGFSYDKEVSVHYWKPVSWTYYFNGTKLDSYSTCHTWVEYGLTVTYSTTDTGYRFTLSRPFKTSGTFKIVGTSYYNAVGYECTKKEVVTIEIEVLKPEFTVKIGLKDCDGTIIDNDGILTEGFDELVYVTAVDPRGIHDFSTDPNWSLSVSAVLSDCDLPTSKVCGIVEGPGCSYGLPIRVVGYDNPNLADDPMVNLYFNSFGAKVKITSFKLVPPTIKVDPKEVPFTIPAGPATHLTFTVTDAHGHGASGVSVSITGTYGAFGVGASGYSWSATTGTTGCKGEVDWGFVPPYSGMYYLGATVSFKTGFICALPCHWPGISTKATIEAVYQAPVVDTVKPVVEASAPATVTSPMVTVAGKVTDNVGVVSLWIGAMKVDFAPDGTFSAKVEVVEGANTIKVVAFDATGNMGDKTLTVTYAVPKVTVVKIQIGSDIMTVNGKAVQIDAPAEIKNGRTFLPLRAISEALGATVDWIAETQGITVTLGKNTIGLQVGNTSAVVNGTVMTLDAAPYIKNNRTMVPFRVIAEGLGATVEWDPALRIVTVTLVQ
jgi:hypothetical protein